MIAAVAARQRPGRAGSDAVSAERSAAAQGAAQHVDDALRLGGQRRRCSTRSATSRASATSVASGSAIVAERARRPRAPRLGERSRSRGRARPGPCPRRSRRAKPSRARVRGDASACSRATRPARRPGAAPARGTRSGRSACGSVSRRDAARRSRAASGPSGTGAAGACPRGCARAMIGGCRSTRPTRQLVFGAGRRAAISILPVSSRRRTIATMRPWASSIAAPDGAHELHVLLEHLGRRVDMFAEDLLLDVLVAALERERRRPSSRPP